MAASLIFFICTLLPFLLQFSLLFSFPPSFLCLFLPSTQYHPNTSKKMVATFPKSATAAAVLDSPTSTFSLLYFDTQGICSTIRNLLALGDAQWTQLYPQDWMNEDLADKHSTPFEVIPVLYVHSQDGSQVRFLSLL